MIDWVVNIVILTLSTIIYFRVADRFNIIDKPNQRSSHSTITIRGGGIVFALSLFVYAVIAYLNKATPDWYFISAVLIAAIASFVDDVITIKPLPRLIAHLVSVVLIIYTTGILQNWGYLTAAIVLICAIGWINTFNFMDGINGITVLYALAILTPIFFHQYFQNHESLISVDLLRSVIAGLLVFGFFNVRKKAKAFAGDVGSVSMALIIAYVLLSGMTQGWGWSAIVMLSVYGIDSVGTILQRIKRRENIFEAHRTHLYQYMANELNMPHVFVSFIYAILQMAINIGWFMIDENQRSTYSLVILSLLAISYFPIKKVVISKAKV